MVLSDRIVSEKRFNRRVALLGAGGVTCAALLSGCSPITTVGPFLSTVARYAQRGMGFVIGEQLGEMAGSVGQDLVDLAISSLDEALEQRIGDPVFGYAQNINLAQDGLNAFLCASFDTPPEPFSSWRTDARAVLITNSEPVIVPAAIALGCFLYAQERIQEFLNAEAVAGENRLAREAELQSWFRANKGVRVYEQISGGESVGEDAVFRALTADDKNYEFEWRPSESLTTQTRLTIREGVVLQGRDPRWEHEVDVGIPSYKLWG